MLIISESSVFLNSIEPVNVLEVFTAFWLNIKMLELENKHLLLIMQEWPFFDNFAEAGDLWAPRCAVST